MATLIIHTDIDCNIYVDTEHYGIAKANEDFIIQLGKGVYWVECRSVADANTSQTFDYKVTSETIIETANIALLYNYRLKELQSKYDYVGEFEYGFAKVSHKGELVGYIDTTYQFRFDDVVALCDNVLCVKNNELYGVLNNGEEIVPIKYKSIKLLGEKMLRLELNDRFCLANLEGVKLTSLKYLAIEYAMNDTYALYFDRWQFVDSDINEVATPNNVILYTTNDNKPITIGNSSIQAHIFHGQGIFIFDYVIIRIEDFAFHNRTNLVKVEIPPSVTYIGQDSFSGCSNLKSITIPHGVRNIEHSAFYNCINLESVFCKPINPPIALKNKGYWHTFSYDDKEWNMHQIKCKIYVPKQATTNYKLLSYFWSEYSDIIVGYDFD